MSCLSVSCRTTDSNTLLIELSSPSVKSGVYGYSINKCGIKSKVLKNVYCNIPKFYDSLNFAVNMPKIEPKGFFL